MEEPIEQDIERTDSETAEEDSQFQPKAAVGFNEATDGFFDFVSSIVGNVASNIAPLGVGIMPAYLTYQHVVYTLMFPNWVGWCSAAVIELMGLGAAQETMIVWNQRRRFKDERNKMPIWAPLTSVVWYVVIMIVFNILLEIKITDPGLTWLKEGIHIFAVALFATLAIPGYTLVAAKTLRKDAMRKREKELEEGRRNRRNKRGQPLSPTKDQGPQHNVRQEVKDWLVAFNIKPSMVGKVVDNNGVPITNTYIADQLGLTEKKHREAIRQYMKQYRDDEVNGKWLW